MEMKRVTRVWAAVTAAAVCAASGDLYAAEKNIKYFAQDQSMQMVTKDYSSLVFAESPCTAVNQMFVDLASCKHCVNDLQPACPIVPLVPDRCLVLQPRPKRAVACTPEDSPIYNVTAPPFTSDTCGALRTCTNTAPTYTCRDSRVSGCQPASCPPAVPPLIIPRRTKCVQDRFTRIYTCEDDDLVTARGCSPTPASGLENCWDKQVYNVTNTTCPWDPLRSCYAYVPSPAFQACAARCSAYAQNYEARVKDYECCLSREIGSTGHDFTDLCMVDACRERVTFPACDTLTARDCAALETTAFNCVSDPTSGLCNACFQPIDDSFQYKFVAKSNERLVVMWQIISQPLVVDRNSNFYTMVKVTDENGVVVHNSLVNQKSFGAAFSIFAATSIDAEAVQSGRTYTVRLYCFVPPVGRGLRIKIERLQLIVMRTRE